MFSQGTSLYSLVRNIGSSIGISHVQALLVRNTQIAHSSLVSTLDMNPSMAAQLPAAGHDLSRGNGLSMLNAEVTRQAAMIAYVDDFTLMLVLTLLVIPLLLLIRPAKQGAGSTAAHVAVD